MKLFIHPCSHSFDDFSNCYVLGTDFPENASGEEVPETRPREALIVDPGNMDWEIVDFIEKNRYRLRGALITHNHRHHVQGLRTLKRIYDVDIYGANPVIEGHRAILARDGDRFSIGAFEVEVISVPGHSADSLVFRVEHLIFTGDALSAGLVGRTASAYAAKTQLAALKSRILSLPGDYTALPGHGPPSFLEAERRFNAGLNSAAGEKPLGKGFGALLEE